MTTVAEFFAHDPCIIILFLRQVEIPVDSMAEWLRALASRGRLLSSQLGRGVLCLAGRTVVTPTSYWAVVYKNRPSRDTNPESFGGYQTS